MSGLTCEVKTRLRRSGLASEDDDIGEVVEVVNDDATATSGFAFMTVVVAGVS